MGMGAASFTGDRVDGLDELRAHLEQAGMCQAHDIRLANAGFEHLVYVLVDAVDHGACLGQEDDLVLALDLPGPHHGLLAVHDPQVLSLESQEHRRLGQVDT